MFNDIGTKIKSFSQGMTSLSIFCYIIVGIGFMANDMVWTGILIALIGSLLSWISSLIFYGLGELIDNSGKILKILELHNCQTNTNLEEEEHSEKNFTE